MPGRAQSKRILVTGGAAGLGAAFVRRLAEEGACVIVADIRDVDGQALAAEVGGAYQHLDVTSEPDWKMALARIEQEFGGLDGLVNNAGIASSVGAEDIEGIALDDLHRIFAVNVDGTVLGCKHAIPLMAGTGPDPGRVRHRLRREQGDDCAPHAVSRDALRAARLWHSLQFGPPRPDPDRDDEHHHRPGRARDEYGPYRR
jgi:NAD(P)-dependent dehydrogenase (short-subunit alcohol dehydrogenase family)